MSAQRIMQQKTVEVAFCCLIISNEISLLKSPADDGVGKHTHAYIHTHIHTIRTAKPHSGGKEVEDNLASRL